MKALNNIYMFVCMYEHRYTWGMFEIKAIHITITLAILTSF